jgi:hypothetical protein
MTMRNPSLFILLPIALASCSPQTGPDANVEVFRTPEQANEYRRQKLHNDWQDLATRIANAERPDIRTIKTDGFALLASADGVQRRIDLAPMAEQLAAAQGKEREPIRAFLAKELPALDRDRLLALGFERAKPRLAIQLANSKQLAEMGVPGRREAPIAEQVVINLFAVPVARWSMSDATTAIDPDVAGQWKVTEDQVLAAAKENVKRAFTQSPDLFDTTDLPGMGRYGSLRTSADPAVVLLPEFLAHVRKQWNTTDDLTLFMPARTSVTFVESKNSRLLDRMIPQWTTLYTKATDPLIATPVVASDKGLTLSTYRPTTQPTPAAPKQTPRPNTPAPAPAPAGPVGPFGK